MDYSRFRPSDDRPKHQDTIAAVRDLLEEMRGLVENGSALDLTRLVGVLTNARDEAQGCTHRVQVSDFGGQHVGGPMNWTNHPEFVHWANGILIRMKLVKNGFIQEPLQLEDIVAGENALHNLTGCREEPRIWY